MIVTVCVSAKLCVPGCRVDIQRSVGLGRADKERSHQGTVGLHRSVEFLHFSSQFVELTAKTVCSSTKPVPIQYSAHWLWFEKDRHDLQSASKLKSGLEVGFFLMDIKVLDGNALIDSAEDNLTGA